jgi:hypothetical protein
MRCESHASFLALTLASPCLGHKPKVRVATNNKSSKNHSKFMIFFEVVTNFEFVKVVRYDQIFFHVSMSFLSFLEMEVGNPPQLRNLLLGIFIVSMWFFYL